LLTLFAAAYAILATAGPVLHTLPGVDHEAHLASLGVPAPGEPKAPPPTPHDDCPVCHLNAQAAFFLSSDDVPVVDVVAIQPPNEPPAVALATPEGPSAPRAPPAVA